MKQPLIVVSVLVVVFANTSLYFIERRMIQNERRFEIMGFLTAAEKGLVDERLFKKTLAHDFANRTWKRGYDAFERGELPPAIRLKISGPLRRGVVREFKKTRLLPPYIEDALDADLLEEQ